jgi:hypothetical protein
MQVVHAVDKQALQAAVELAHTLRGRGMIAAESAGIDGVARVLVFSRSSAQLAEQVYVVPSDDDGLWFQWEEGEWIGPVGEVERAVQSVVDTIHSCS